jgi:hypothetical protein
MVARDAYCWAWPMVNIYNRRLAFKQALEAGLMNGVLPFAPLNTMAMLHDYVEPKQRWVACPNQDVVYGAGIAALDETFPDTVPYLRAHRLRPATFRRRRARSQRSFRRSSGSGSSDHA